MTNSLQRIILHHQRTAASLVQDILVQWARMPSVMRVLTQRIQDALGRLGGSAKERVQNFLRTDFSWFRNKGFAGSEINLSVLLQHALEWKLRSIAGSPVEFEIHRFELHPDDDGLRIRLELWGNEFPFEVEVPEETFENEIAQKLREFGAKSPTVTFGRRSGGDVAQETYSSFVLLPFDAKKLLLEVMPPDKLEELAQAVIDDE